MVQPELPLSLPPKVAKFTKPKRADERVRYAKCRPARRTLCDDCVAAIRERGFTVAPPPNLVRWKRTRKDTKTLLICEAHKQEREAAGA